MKIGAENRKKVWAAAILLVLALLMFFRMLVSDSNTSSASTQTPASPATATTTRQARRVRPRSSDRKPMIAAADNLDPRLRLDLLKESENTKYSGNGRNIFRGYELEDIPKPIARATPPPQVSTPSPPPLPPPPPPINLKFFGFASQSGDKSVFLSDGEVVFVAKVGDIVNRRYRVMKINANSVEILDVLNNRQQTIQLQPGATS
ncbi:MAG TPA: hypothetical protein VK473_02985 [Terriglobales bacterium]|nr:hypothetical protein [Terriglobales bacterium]